MGEEINAYRILELEPEGNTPLRRYAEMRGYY
jgi:hypothetical protein